MNFLDLLGGLAAKPTSRTKKFFPWDFQAKLGEFEVHFAAELLNGETVKPRGFWDDQTRILLMEEIPNNHLGCIKSYK